MAWYDPPLVPTYSHLLGLASASFTDDAGITGGATGGRTTITNKVGEAAASSGTVSRVMIRVATRFAGGSWKVKVFRPNAGAYDLVGESETFLPGATGTYTRDLSSPITGVQSGDWVGVWMNDGNNSTSVHTTTGTATVLYGDGDKVGNGNTFAGSFDNFSLCVEGLVASGTAATTAHWAGTVPAGWGIVSQVNSAGAGGRTLISGIKTERLLQHGTITAVKLSVSVAGTGSIWKVKVFRPNGSNYDFVAESEAFSSPGTGTQTFTLGTPITGCQPGDVIGVWIGDAGTAKLNVTSLTATAGIRYLEGDNTGSNQDFSNTVNNFSLNIQALGVNPFLAVTGDSISVGHALSSNWEDYFDGDGPFGTIAHSPGYQIRQLAGAGFYYQGLGKGSQTFDWVGTTAFPNAGIGVEACNPLAVWVHCGVNDISAGDSNATIQGRLDVIRTALATILTSSTACRNGSAPHLFVTEVLPWTAGDDTKAAAVRSWNTALASWASGKSNVTVVQCHDAMGQTRVSTGQLDDLLSSYDDGSGIHLSQAGVNKLASLVYTSLLAYYGPLALLTTDGELSGGFWDGGL